MTAHVGRGNRMPDEVAARLLEAIASGKATTTACALAGWSERTLLRWAHRTPENQADYDAAVCAGREARRIRCVRPCSCAECRRSNRERMARWRETVRLRGFAGLRHGALSTYEAGCRCAECSARKSADNSRRYSARRRGAA